MSLSSTIGTAGMKALPGAWLRDRDGGVAISVAVTVAVLVGLASLSLDLGRMYNLSTELDNAADAYALAGATQLDQTPGSCARAIDAAVNVAMRNQETFAINTSGPITIDPTPNPIGNGNIRFLSDIVKDARGVVTGTYITAGASDCDNGAQFIEVTIDTDAATAQYEVEFFLSGVLGAVTSANPIGYAIAGIGRAFCGEVPMFMCPVNDTAAAFWAKINSFEHTGKGLWLKSGRNNVQWGDGNFGFLSMGGSGVPDLEQALGMIGNQLQCLGGEDVETEPGNSSGARDGFNTRFDIYEGNLKTKNSDPAWRPAADPVKGMMRNKASNCTIGGQGYNDPPTPYSGSGSSPLPQAMGLPMDDCAYGGSCDASAGNQGRMGDGEWGRQDYLDVNHGGLPLGVVGYEDVDWDGPGGLHPDGLMSRYEAYLWELDRLSTDTAYGTSGPLNRLVDNTGAPAGPAAFPQAGEYGRQQCSTAAQSDAGLDQDRRVLEVFLVDCENVPGGISGRTTFPAQYIIGTIDLFLMTPWVVNGNNHEIYTEIIGPGSATGIQKQAARQIVQLYE